MPLPALESALQAWLREQLPWAADAGDISFDSPDMERLIKRGYRAKKTPVRPQYHPEVR